MAQPSGGADAYPANSTRSHITAYVYLYRDIPGQLASSWVVAGDRLQLIAAFTFWTAPPVCG